jgi:hypothetical protein
MPGVTVREMGLCERSDAPDVSCCGADARRAASTAAAAAASG